MDEPFETYEHAGMTIELYPEYDAEHLDPREWDNLGIMVCWHPDYYLGDYQIKNPAGRGAVKNAFPQTYFESFEELVDYLKEEEKAVCILGLTVYEHSGLTMYVGGKYDFPFDSAGWDTTETGFIYTTPEKIAEHGTPEDKVEEALRQEVKTYAAWLEGDVIAWVLRDKDGEVVDSCGGYIDDYDYAKKEAEAAAEFYEKERLINQEPTDVAEALA